VIRAASPSGLSLPRLALLAILIVVLFAANTWAVYTLLTSRAPFVVWDFHTPWLGLQHMLQDGMNPYGDEVTLAIQQQRYGRPAHVDEDQLAFAYPLHLVALMGPLALLPLPVAQAVWFSLLEASLLAFVLVAPWAVGWRPPAWLLGLTAFFTLGLYPNVWAVILGQVSLVVAALVALAWWSLRARRWRLAGVCLALATVKPQMTFLLVPAVLAWAIYTRRWRLVISFAVSMSLLLALPAAWLPNWPWEWVRAVYRYTGYTVFDPPLQMITGSGWPGWLMAVLLLAWTVYVWRRAPESDAIALGWAPAMIVAVSALIAPRTSYANQLILLLPLFFVFTRLSNARITALIEAGLLIGLWLVDFTLLPPASSQQHVLWQHRIISPILPVGLTLALLYLSPSFRRAEALAEVPGP
jgi:hypothetical protein